MSAPQTTRADKETILQTLSLTISRFTELAALLISLDGALFQDSPTEVDREGYEECHSVEEFSNQLLVRSNDLNRELSQVLNKIL